MVSSTKSKSLAVTVPTADFDAVLARANAKDRANIMRYVESGDANLWKRVFCVMAALAPHTLQATGQISVQFYVADGKHRLQIFALEDARQGTLNLYIPDCLDKAISAKILRRPAGESNEYPIQADEKSSLQIEQLTAANTTNAPEFFRHMLGWNRKAVRVGLPVGATAAQIHAAEILCVLGAQLRVPEGAPAGQSAKR